MYIGKHSTVLTNEQVAYVMDGVVILLHTLLTDGSVNYWLIKQFHLSISFCVIIPASIWSLCEFRSNIISVLPFHIQNPIKTQSFIARYNLNNSQRQI